MMHDCLDADRIAFALLGDAAPAERAAVVAHLEACAACSDIAGFLAEPPDAPEPSPALVARVQLGLRRAQAPRSRPWAVVAAAAVVLAAVSPAFWGMQAGTTNSTRWRPAYAAGQTEQVTVRLSMRGALETPAGRRPLDREIHEQYERRIVAAESGVPTETVRTYTTGDAAGAALALRRTASHGTEVASPRDGTADWLLASDGRTAGVLEESLGFFAPGRSVAAGDTWTPAAEPLRRLLDRFLADTLGDVVDVAAECRLLGHHGATSEAEVRVRLRAVQRAVDNERTATGELVGRLELDHTTGRVRLLWLASDTTGGLMVRGRTAQGPVEGRVDLHLQLSAR